ncbi:S-DNA-T family DNA segregation ATPase FtsK/SpoIIIE [Arthrobacter sp. CAN_A2]|uniref:FtsK/SpoIIIE domain-containing protein n=1 Tax=Arthrobacter sp. CAN_A2 TaxID=2787718 RepID=UPI0018EF8A0A
MDLHVTLAGAPPTAFAPREIVVDTEALRTGAVLAARLVSAGYQGPFTVDGRPLAALLPHSAEFTQGAVIVCGAPPGPPAVASLPHLAFVVCSGPDAGQVIPLTRGSYVIGRAAADITLADPALSRHHALLTVTEDSILLEDLRSVNGTFVDGERTTTAGITGATDLRIGGSRCRIALVDDPGWTAGDPRDVLEPLSVVAELPGKPSRVVVLTALLPLILGAVLALTTGLWFFLAFSALSAVTGLVPLMTYRRKAAAFASAVRDAAGKDRARRESAAPDPGRTGFEAVRAGRHPPSGAVRAAGPEPELVLLRLGLADQPANLTAARAESTFEPPTLDAVPLLLPCSRAADITGNTCTAPFTITGDAEGVQGVLRALLLQAAHPRSGAPTLVCWGPARDLPHHARFLPNVHLTHDEGVLASLAARAALLLVFQLSGDLPGLAAANVCVIRFATGPPPERALTGSDAGPGGSGMMLTAGAAGARLGGRDYEVLPDGVSARTFERTARALARAAALDPAASADPRRTRPTALSALPESASLWSEDLMPDTLAATIPGRWTTSDGEHAAAHVGRSGDGPLSIDLAKDGPHLLVAGTTGSGKSEFLRTLVLGLALNQPPEHLALLLVDYKGGAGLGPLGSLPHCVGSLTDLSSESTGRALTSLRAELRRRERLCSEHGAPGLDGLRRIAPGGCPPRLVIVIDEFRMLSDDVPSAIPDLMKIASLGRSLGVHLVLATQRVQGAVTPDMRANITSSVLLRVQAPMESQDLLGTSAAADIPVDTPGRAFLRRGSEAPIAFQVASSRDVPAATHITGWQDLATHIGGASPDPARVATPVGGTALSPRGGTVLDRAVDALRSAAGGTAAPRARRPVLPPLPAALAARDCEGFLPVTAESGAPGAPRGSGGIALGIVDFPDRQEQRLLFWRPEQHSHLAFIGLPGSGATEALAAISSCLPVVDPDVHLYLLDGDGSLAGCSARPHVGAYVRSDETKRAGRVLERLVGLADGRAGGGPRVALVVTGWGRWSSQFRQGRFARAEDDLQSLVRDGAARGVTVCIAGDRELTTARFFALLPNRVYLPFGAQPETTLTWPKMPPMDAVAGRGFAQGRLTGSWGDGTCQLVLVAAGRRPPSPPDTPCPGAVSGPPAAAHRRGDPASPGIHHGPAAGIDRSPPGPVRGRPASLCGQPAPRRDLPRAGPAEDRTHHGDPGAGGFGIPAPAVSDRPHAARPRAARGPRGVLAGPRRAGCTPCGEGLSPARRRRGPPSRGPPAVARRVGGAGSRRGAHRRAGAFPDDAGAPDGTRTRAGARPRPVPEVTGRRRFPRGPPRTGRTPDPGPRNRLRPVGHRRHPGGGATRRPVRGFPGARSAPSRGGAYSVLPGPVVRVVKSTTGFENSVTMTAAAGAMSRRPMRGLPAVKKGKARITRNSWTTREGDRGQRKPAASFTASATRPAAASRSRTVMKTDPPTEMGSAPKTDSRKPTDRAMKTIASSTRTAAIKTTPGGLAARCGAGSVATLEPYPTRR